MNKNTFSLFFIIIGVVIIVVGFGLVVAVNQYFIIVEVLGWVLAIVIPSWINRKNKPNPSVEHQETTNLSK